MQLQPTYHESLKEGVLPVNLIIPQLHKAFQSYASGVYDLQEAIYFPSPSIDVLQLQQIAKMDYDEYKTLKGYFIELTATSRINDFDVVDFEILDPSTSIDLL